MGYRSDVAGIIKFNSSEDRAKFIVLAQAHGGNMALNFDEKRCNWDFEHEHSPIMTFRYEDVKWYKDYKDVKCHYELCEYAEKTFEAEWRIVSIGEDGKETEDSSENHYLWDCIGTRHIIETNF